MTRAVLIAVLGLVGCLRPPEKLAGVYERVSVRDAATSPREGIAVRWGGQIVSMRPGKQQTCFEIVGMPLDAQARPQPSDQSQGRFLACAPGYYEPTTYLPGREVTVVGALHGVTVGKVGDYDYTFPRVDATTIYLWPERTARGGWSPPVAISIGGIFGH